MVKIRVNWSTNVLSIPPNYHGGFRNKKYIFKNKKKNLNLSYAQIILSANFAAIGVLNKDPTAQLDGTRLANY